MLIPDTKTNLFLRARVLKIAATPAGKEGNGLITRKCLDKAGAGREQEFIPHVLYQLLTEGMISQKHTSSGMTYSVTTAGMRETGRLVSEYQRVG